MIKPDTADTVLKGTPAKVTVIPAISSITMLPGSLRPNCFSAMSAAYTAKPARAMTIANENHSDKRDSKKHGNSPNSEPKVPGATGILPIGPPVARNSIAAW